MRTSSIASIFAALGLLVFGACDTRPAAPIDDADDDAGLEASAPDAADASTGPTAKGDRVLGVDLSVDKVSFNEDAQLIVGAGARTTNVTFAWDDVERPLGGGDGGADAGDGGAPVLFNAGLHVAGLVLSTNGLHAVFGLDALDVTGPRLPVDIVGQPLDAETVGERYARALDYVLDQTRDIDLDALIVASSVDRTLGDDATKWSTFAGFVARASAHAKTRRPGVRVGFGLTSNGLISRGALAASALSSSDLVVVTHLAVDASGKALPPASIEETFAAIEREAAKHASGKSIILREAAYPSAAAAGSSDRMQADAIRATFMAWDHHAERIPTLMFLQLSDIDPSEAAAVAARHGHAASPAFEAVYGSLGLRHAAGAKPAWSALGAEAKARGFERR